MTEKFNEDGVRVCDQAGCENQAVFWYVWDGPMVVCADHTAKVLGIATAMGFPTPGRTLRLLTADELMPSEGADDDVSR